MSFSHWFFAALFAALGIGNVIVMAQFHSLIGLVFAVLAAGCGVAVGAVWQDGRRGRELDPPGSV